MNSPFEEYAKLAQDRESDDEGLLADLIDYDEDEGDEEDLQNWEKFKSSGEFVSKLEKSIGNANFQCYLISQKVKND